MSEHQRRLYAYYYGFDATGVDAVDIVLSAVACAGKQFHSTDRWTDECDSPSAELTGPTPRDRIQYAANRAADQVNTLRAQLAAANEARAVAQTNIGAYRYAFQNHMPTPQGVPGSGGAPDFEAAIVTLRAENARLREAAQGALMELREEYEYKDWLGTGSCSRTADREQKEALASVDARLAALAQSSADASDAKGGAQ